MTLCDFVDDAVRKNYTMVASTRIGNSVDLTTTTPIALNCCICWLVGGSHYDICLTAGDYISHAHGLQGHSHMRKLVLEDVNAEGLFRPIHNIIRNYY